MPTISKDNKLLTLINVFTVEPAKQQQLVALLIHATESSVRHVTGFISASLHRSLDGTRVVMYAQWRSVEDYDAMRDNPSASPYMQQAVALAQFELGMYEVVETFSAVNDREHGYPRPASASALLRHFADLRDGTHGGARPRRDKEPPFPAALPPPAPPSPQAVHGSNTH